MMRGFSPTPTSHVRGSPFVDCPQLLRDILSGTVHTHRQCRGSTTWGPSYRGVEGPDDCSAVCISCGEFNRAGQTAGGTRDKVADLLYPARVLAFIYCRCSEWQSAVEVLLVQALPVTEVMKRFLVAVLRFDSAAGSGPQWSSPLIHCSCCVIYFKVRDVANFLAWLYSKVDPCGYHGDEGCRVSGRLMSLATWLRPSGLALCG
jgi:hypothetical protein